MAKYQFTPEFSTRLNIENATDETYYTNIGTFGQIAYGSPRTVSLSAKYDF
jgi:outer membrane receptor for ferric coprogen and ferric-rhodotorulic acid